MEELVANEVSIVRAVITTSGEINTYCTRGFKNPINKAKWSSYTERWHKAMAYWQHRTSLHNGWTQPACCVRQREAQPAKSQREILKWLTKLYDLQVLLCTVSLVGNLFRSWERLEPRLAIIWLILSLERSQKGVTPWSGIRRWFPICLQNGNWRENSVSILNHICVIIFNRQVAHCRIYLV